LRRKQEQVKQGLLVEVRNGDFAFALRKFKKKVQEDGILQELRERQHFEKPSETRKKAKAAGRARWLKKQRKQADERGW
jgi:small subunit ribosomal protein S21|tara:strand:- start:363 stop:599 length:237 start_codon:yes stop_codon:yes gene_type:complete